MATHRVTVTLGLPTARHHVECVIKGKFLLPLVCPCQSDEDVGLPLLLPLPLIRHPAAMATKCRSGPVAEVFLQWLRPEPPVVRSDLFSLGQLCLDKANLEGQLYTRKKLRYHLNSALTIELLDSSWVLPPPLVADVSPSLL